MDMRRREFLQWSGISAAGAMLSACSKPTESLIPFLVPPEDGQIPGVAQYYASTCRQCPAGCGILVRIAEGRAKKIEGNPLHPVSRGRLCARGQAALQELYHPDRLRQPMKRTGPRGSGTFEPISWDEGLKLLVGYLKDLQDQGQSEQLLMITPRLSGTLAALVKDFLGAYGSRHWLDYELLNQECLAKAHAALFGRPDMPDLDLENTHYLLSFGADLFETYLSPVRYGDGFGKMRQARRTIRGAFVYAGARLSMTAASADDWLPVRPGEEGALALGMARVILEEGLYDGQALAQMGVSARQWLAALDDYRLDGVAERTGLSGDEIAAKAREFAQTQPGVAVAGESVMAQTNGVDAVRAIHGLNLLVGNVGKPGGLLFAERRLSHGGVATYADLRSMVEAMGAGRIRLALVYRSNPVHAYPKATGFQEVLQKVPAVVSFASLLDDTARQADLILPDHTDLESWGDVVPWAGVHTTVTGLVQPVVKPLFDTRAFPDLLMAAARGLGGAVQAALPEDGYLTRLKGAVAAERNLSEGTGFDVAWMKALQQGGIFGEAPTTFSAVQGAAPFAQRQGATPRFDGEEGAYPFHLTVYPRPAFNDGRNAHLPWLQELPDPISTAVWGSWVEINPKTAAALGIGHGDLVRVDSTQGSLQVPAVIVPAIRPDVVAMPMGQGHEGMGRYADGRGVNPLDLVAGLMDEANGLPAWGATRVRIERLSDQGDLVVMGHPEGSYHGELLEI